MAGVLLGLPSCSNEIDPNDLMLHPINTAVIVGLGNTQRYNAVVGEILTIDPIVVFLEVPNGPAPDFSFAWYMGGEVISEEEILRVRVEGELARVLGNRDNIMAFRVTDNNTGIVVTRTVYLNVTSRLTRGWLALTERDNSYDIDFLVNFNDTVTLHTGILDMFESTVPRLGETPKAFHAFQNNRPLRMGPINLTGYTIWVQTDKAIYNLNAADNYSLFSSDLLPFAVPGTPAFSAGFIPGRITTFSHSAVRLYMKYDGNMYSATSQNGLFPFEFPINRVSGENNDALFNVSPYVFGTVVGASLLFDEDNKRFLRHNHPPAGATSPSRGITFLHPLFDTAEDVALFSWTDNIERLVYMSNYNTNAGFAIIKDKVLGYRYLEFATSTSVLANNVMNKSFGRTFNDNAFIESAKFFAKHPSQPYFYMASEDKVYRMMVSTNELINMWEDVTDEVLKQGYRISVFQFTANNGSTGSPQGYITVGSYNPNGKVGENGRIEFFNVDGATGNFTPRETVSGVAGGEFEEGMSFTGIGKPIGISYKNQ
jgi:hypothetical protein